MGLVADLTIVIVAALVGGFVAQRLRQPLIVGYILAGVVVGPLTGGLTAEHAHNIEQLAEVGVMLLLFALGLELSFRELAPVRGVALGGATVQILATIALGFALGRALGWPWATALWFGALISLSSTMVALKTIQAQGRLGTLSSRVMLGILVVQDLAVVPLMIVLPELSTPSTDLAQVGLATLRAFAMLGAIVLVATRLVPPLMALVARWNSRELFLLTTTALALGIGYSSWTFGLSPALGAFIAGLVISESEYSHQALSDVIPLRDLFGMLFFVSVGLLLQPGLAWQQPLTLLSIVVAVMAGKALILAAVVRLFGYWNVVPWAVGLTLFQVGEFAFVLASVGRATGAIDTEMYSLVLDTAIVTMVLTPLVSGLTPAIYARVRARRPREAVAVMNMPTGGLSDHIVVTGAGRVGRSIVDALLHLKLPCVLIEFDDRRACAARDAGLPAVYGDASQAVVLEAAGIERARAMIVTVPAFPDVRSIVAAVQKLTPDLPIIARADGHDAVHALYAMGVHEVTSPEFEAGIEMTRGALGYLDVPAHDILRVANVIRLERYGVPGPQLDEQRALLPQLGELTRLLDFSWLRLPADSPLANHTIAELQIRTRTGASIVGVTREGRLIANPDGNARLEAGDVVAVLGTPDQIARFERAAIGDAPTSNAERGVRNAERGSNSECGMRK
jgi:monovalent cation:H+ antiporter-2, CPA2 family